MQNKQNINIYLNKDLYDKLDRLATLMDMPISRVVRLMLNEEVVQETLETLIYFTEKEIAKNERKQ